MQHAHIMLALGGDTGNTIPKYNVTIPEIAVLRHIHGEEAVFDIEITRLVTKPSHREERARLASEYGRNEGDRMVAPAVDALFPGAASPLFTRIEELGLPEELFRATERASPGKDAEPETDPELDLDPATDTKVEPETDTKVEPETDTKVEPETDTKVEPETDTKVEPETDTEVEEDENDGISDMPPSVMD